MSVSLWQAAVAVLIWPGLIGGAVLGWLLAWLNRKIVARMQGRFGPPLAQPFFDFVKLLAKQTVTPRGVQPPAFLALPVVSLVSVTVALALVPAPGNPLGSFAGDVVLLLYLLEMPAVCDVLAGYVSRSIYSQVGAVREATLALAGNLPFLGAVVALATHADSLRLSDIAAAPFGPVHVLAAAAFLLAMPARLKINPFSIPNAEHEIVAGAHVEYNGAPLALWELAHALEFVALVGLFAALFVRAPGPAGYVVVCVVLTALASLLAAATARLKIHQAFRFYWRWGLAAAVLTLVAAALR